MKQGGWIFISHSHQDIQKVRRIRNRLEELGLEPLMFYLKCLTDENEIVELIKREIDERDWFVYADSANARSSKWVKTEREYIESLTGKNVFTIYLDGNIEEQLAMVEHISRQMKVFISYSHKDKELASRIRERLVERDLMVLSDTEMSPGGLWAEQITDQIQDAARNGFVILLLTENSIHSRYVLNEIDMTVQAGGRIVPVLVGDTKLTNDLLYYVGDIPAVRISEAHLDSELDSLVERILHDVEFNKSDFRDTVGYRSARTVRLPEISRIDNMTFFGCDDLEEVTVPDSVIYITPDAFEDHPDILVRCRAGSYAEGYCRRNGVKFEILED
jgi:hypothetical protein